MKVALIQMNSQDDKAANLEHARRLIEQAIAEERPDLVALPEIFPLISEDSELKKAAAEPVPGGEAYGMLQELAAKHGIVLHGGSILEQNGETMYNTTVVFDRDGSELARYRKLHLFDIVTPDGKEYRESATFSRGARTVCFDALGTRFGLSICYDIRFAELYLQLAKDGAKVIMVPAAFTLQTAGTTGRCCCARGRSKLSAMSWRRLSGASSPAAGAPATATRWWSIPGAT
jgi:predicted amidohydrolase